MFIVEKNFRLSNNRDTIIPTVVKIATKEEVNNKTFSIINIISGYCYFEFFCMQKLESQLMQQL